jgi:peroxiredoxin
MDGHRQFAANFTLPFPLLVDHSGVDAQFGVERPDGSIRRAPFLVDERCRIQFRWTVARSARL